jgi:DMSO/TMAO reductase YedYZ molybdopterin-dependent catalytic subunit
MNLMDELNNGSSRSSLERVKQADMPAILYVDGLVATPQAFMREDLASLKRVSCTEDFHCDHKETAPAQVWRGVSLLELIQLARPHPEAKYVRVHAQNYSVPLALSEIEGALLAESLNGRFLTIERGAPWRLYVPGAHCHVSVKWVNRLELTATRASTPADRATRARERGQLASTAT